MPRDRSQSQNGERVSLHVRLLEEVNAGHLDGLECPQCKHLAVSVYFTHPAAEECRTWFICSICDFHS